MASLNKQALLRYRIIDELISRKNHPTMQDIIALCEDRIGKKFSKETLQKDIEAMKNDLSLGYEAPIYFNRNYKGYEYTNSEYTIKKINLNDAEFGILEDTIDILKQFKGTSLSHNFNSALDKISTTIREVKEEKSIPVISLEPQPEHFDIEIIDKYIKLIKKDIVISVLYVEANKFIGDFIHPYMLKEYRNRWYIIAYSEIFKEIKVYNIGYLYDIYELTKRKFIHKTFNHEQYFKDSIGIEIIEGLKEKVQIKFAKNAYDSVNSTPIHPSQKIIKQLHNGGFIIEIEVYITNELLEIIFSYASSAKVLKPNWLIGIIKCTILNMSKIYNVQANDCSKKYKKGKKK